MSHKYPLEVKITYPKEKWPWDEATNERNTASEAYSIEEIAVLMVLCTDTNTLGICRTNIKTLLERLGLNETKENIQHYAQVVNRLLRRNNMSDYVRLHPITMFDPNKPKETLQVQVEQCWHRSTSRFFTLTNIEFDNVLSCAIKHNKNSVTMLSLYVALKSFFYYVEHDERKLTAGIVAKSVLAKRCGLSQPTIDTYLYALLGDQIISCLSGKAMGVANIYCPHGHEAALQIMMKRQLDYISANGGGRIVHRMSNKRFEGAY